MNVKGFVTVPEREDQVTFNEQIITHSIRIGHFKTKLCQEAGWVSSSSGSLGVETMRAVFLCLQANEVELAER